MKIIKKWRGFKMKKLFISCLALCIGFPSAYSIGQEIAEPSPIAQAIIIETGEGSTRSSTSTDITPISPRTEQKSSRLPRNRIPRERLQSNPIPSNRLPRERIPSNRLPQTRIPRESLSRERIPSNRLPRTRIPSNPLPRERVPSNKIPRVRVPTGQHAQ